jgi:hypothetical protein
MQLSNCPAWPCCLADAQPPATLNATLALAPPSVPSLEPSSATMSAVAMPEQVPLLARSQAGPLARRGAIPLINARQSAAMHRAVRPIATATAALTTMSLAPTAHAGPAPLLHADCRLAATHHNARLGSSGAGAFVCEASGYTMRSMKGPIRSGSLAHDVGWGTSLLLLKREKGIVCDKCAAQKMAVVPLGGRRPKDQVQDICRGGAMRDGLRFWPKRQGAEAGGWELRPGRLRGATSCACQMRGVDGRVPTLKLASRHLRA